MTAPAAELRPGLPAELRVLADRYPRNLWQGHANFSGMTAFWLDRHRMFRDLSDKLITLSRAELDAPGSRFLAEMPRYTSFLLNHLQTHHMVEDHHYFPQLVGLDPRIEHAFDLLERDHEEMDVQMHGLAASALRAITCEAERDAVAALLESQEALQRFLDRHLTDEEDVIVPLILEHGPDLQ